MSDKDWRDQDLTIEDRAILFTNDFAYDYITASQAKLFGELCAARIATEAVKVLSASFCEKHQLEVKNESFDEFRGKETGRCGRCLQQKLDAANALSDERKRLMLWAMDSTFKDRDPVKIVVEFQKHFTETEAPHE